MAVVAVQLAVAVAMSAISYALSDRVDKNKMDDKNPVSQYGDNLRVVIGTMRVPGTLIWAPEFIERSKSYSQKGFGQKVKEYFYYGNFHLKLSADQSQALLSIFNNSVKKYSNSNATSLKSKLASTDFAKAVRFYDGQNPNELPDPLIESYEGRGEVSAHRGQTTLLIEEFPIESGTNMTFEAVVATNTEPFASYDLIYKSEDVFRNGSYFDVIDENNYVDYKAFRDNKEFGLHVRRVKSNGEVVSNDKIVIYNEDKERFPTLWISTFALYKTLGNVKAIHCIDSNSNDYIFYDGGGVTEFEKTNNGTGTDKVYFGSKFNTTFIYRERDTFQIRLTKNGRSVNLSLSKALKDFDITANYVYLLFNKKIERINLSDFSTEIIHTATGAGYLCNLSIVNDDIIYFTHYRNLTLTEIKVLKNGTAELVNNITFSNIATSSQDQFFTKDGQYSSFLRNIDGAINFLSYTTIGKAVTLSDALLSVARKLKIDVNSIDVEDLKTISLNGYQYSLNTDFKSIAKDLSEVFFFDSYTNDEGKQVFVKRGKEPQYVIHQSDLGAGKTTGSIQEAFQITTKQDSDLPGKMVINFYDANSDYRRASTFVVLQTTSSNNTVTIDKQIAFTPDEARTTALQMMLSQWIGRETYKFTVGEKHSFIQETDVLQVVFNSNVYTMRVNKKTDKLDGTYDIEATAEDATIYQQKAVGIPASPGGITEVEYRADSKIVFLDVPLLRDQDEGKGIYYAVGPTSKDSWRGCVVQTSIDGGVSFVDLNSHSKEKASILGTAQTALPDFKQSDGTEDAQFDFKSTVTVKTNGVAPLTSTTLTELNTGLVNTIYLGGELLQFLTATPVQGQENTFVLSGLVRGLKGTEAFKSTHSAGETFVLLDETKLQLIPLTLSELDNTRHFKAVTFGSSAEKVQPVAVTYKGNAYECYSPVHCGGGFNNDGAILKWTRRGRLQNDWLNRVDVPIGETTESYEIEILKNGVVVRILKSTTTTINYSNAQMIEDFGSVQTKLTFNVFQMSSVTGKGNKGTGTIYK